MKTEETASPPRKLDDWVELIREQEMPIFDGTVQQVLAVSQDDLAPASELARVVLQDASLTARVLKLANSVYFNPMGASAGGAISTVSRAVIVLGFNAVSNMCLTATLVDAMVQGATARQRVAREMARAIHAATQARTIAIQREDSSPEEVFIATLLGRIGELAFWCFAGELTDELERLYRQPGMTPERAQQQLLGFHLDRLSAQLARAWHLTDLTRQGILTPEAEDPRVQTVVLGQDIAECAETQGWQSDTMLDLVRRAAKMIKQSVGETQQLLHQNARDARAIAADVGARFAIAHIPQPDTDAPASDTGATAQPAQDSEPNCPEPDSALQLRVLRELSISIEQGKADLNLIMELVLEGIYRGVGMDRVVLALVSPDRRLLKARHGLGVDRDIIERFNFARLAGQTHLFFEAMERRRPLYFDQERLRSHQSALPKSVTQVLGSVPFMIAPIVIAERAIGLLYADRGLSGRELSLDLFEDFKHFAQQAGMGLTLASQRGRRA